MPILTSRRSLLAVNLIWVEDLFGDKFELFRSPFFQSAVETGLVADVALARIDGNFEDDAILVAIDEDLADLLDVA